MCVHFEVIEERASPNSLLNLRCEDHCEGASPSPVTAEGAEAPWLDASLSFRHFYEVPAFRYAKP